MLNRWIERDGLKDTLAELGMGSIVFTPLAQGMLTSKYLNGVPSNSRGARGTTLSEGFLSEENIENIRQLNRVAEGRGQTLAQMAIAWCLRGGEITSALIGASKAQQVIDCVGALENLEFTAEELAEIDCYAVEGDINLWAGATSS